MHLGNAKAEGAIVADFLIIAAAAAEDGAAADTVMHCRERVTPASAVAPARVHAKQCMRVLMLWRCIITACQARTLIGAVVETATVVVGGGWVGSDWAAASWVMTHRSTQSRTARVAANRKGGVTVVEGTADEGKTMPRESWEAFEQVGRAGR